jgi:hypothetical protein
LPVRPVASAQAAASPDEQYELLTPRFVGRIALTPNQSLSVLAGQRGVAALPTSGRSIAGFLRTRVSHWLLSRTPDVPDVL